MLLQKSERQEQDSNGVEKRRTRKYLADCHLKTCDACNLSPASKIDRVLQIPIYGCCQVVPKVWKEQNLTRVHECSKLANKSCL